MLLPDLLQRWNCQSHNQNQRHPTQDDEQRKPAYCPRYEGRLGASGAHAAFASHPAARNVPASGTLTAEAFDWRGEGELVAATRTSVPAARRWTASSTHATPTCRTPNRGQWWYRPDRERAGR